MEHTTLILTILRGITVLMGVVFLYFTGKSYLKHRQSNILLLFIAISVLTLGAITEGAVVQLLDMDLATAHILESVALLIAFAILLWSVLHKPRFARPVKENAKDDDER